MAENQYKYNCALVIDDDDTDSYINKRILEITNFAKHIVVKNSCSEAIDFLKQRSASNEQIPDVVFLDYFMPLRGGGEFLERFKGLPSNVTEKSKVVMLSVIDHALNPEQFDRQFVSESITKPLTQDKLEELFIVHASSEKNQ